MGKRRRKTLEFDALPLQDLKTLAEVIAGGMGGPQEPLHLLGDILLDAFWHNLTAEEQQVLIRRYNLDDGQRKRTQEQVAEEGGGKRWQVRAAEGAGLRKLRFAVREAFRNP